jgi:hypothetical protein
VIAYGERPGLTVCKRILRRHAIAMSGCLDVSELESYQYGRHSRAGVTVYNFGDGCAIALNPGQAVPAWLTAGIWADSTWTIREVVGGWAVWTSGNETAQARQ